MYSLYCNFARTSPEWQPVLSNLREADNIVVTIVRGAFGACSVEKISALGIFMPAFDKLDELFVPLASIFERAVEHFGEKCTG